MRRYMLSVNGGTIISGIIMNLISATIIIIIIIVIIIVILIIIIIFNIMVNPCRTALRTGSHERFWSHHGCK